MYILKNWFIQFRYQFIPLGHQHMDRLGTNIYPLIRHLQQGQLLYPYFWAYIIDMNNNQIVLRNNYFILLESLYAYCLIGKLSGCEKRRWKSYLKCIRDQYKFNLSDQKAVWDAFQTKVDRSNVNLTPLKTWEKK